MKSRKIIFRTVLISLIFGLSAFLFFSSCEVGLGAAVDTEPPVLSINYPPTSAVVRGTFILAGSCDDDLGADRVIITVKNTDTNEEWGPFSASVNNKKWALELNHSGDFNGFEYRDGQYVFTGHAIDKAGRESGATSHSFYIDNTAPVLILSKPMAVGTETPSKFGKTINLTGDVADDSALSKLTINYRQFDKHSGDWSGDEDSLSVSGFNTLSSDSPLVIAKYYSPADIEKADASQKAVMQAQRDNYIKIYGEEDADTAERRTDKYFYANFIIEDAAKLYVNPGDNGSGTGNQSAKYYINSDKFYEDVTKGLELTALSIKNMINGKTPADANIKGKTPAEILTSLDEFAQPKVDALQPGDEVRKTSSVFVVNPDNSPNYSITGYQVAADNYSFDQTGNRIDNAGGNGTPDYLESDDYSKFHDYSVSDNLSFSIAAGKDQIPIDADSLEVYLYHLKDDDETLAQVKERYNNATETEKATIRYQLVKKSVKDAQGVVTTAGDWAGEGNKTAINKSIKLDDIETKYGYVHEKLWKAGDFYCIEVIGEDEKGEILEPAYNSGFGFQAYVNAQPPKISFKTASEKYFNGTTLSTAPETIEIEIELDGSLKGSGTDQLYADADDFGKRLLILPDRTASEEGIKIDSDITVSYVKPVSATPVSNDPNNTKYTIELKVGGDSASVPTVEGKYKYSFVLKYKDKNAKTSSESFAFFVDNKKPDISVSAIGPTVSKENDSEIYLNGKTVISGVVQDNNQIKTVDFEYYEIPKAQIAAYKADKDLKAAWKVAALADSKTVNNANYTIAQPVDTTKVADGNGFVIKIIAKDTVDNESSKVSSLYIVDQTTDKPMIKGSNFGELSKESSVTAKPADGKFGNVFDKTSRLIGSITDDDGLEEAYLKIFAADDNIATATPVKTVDLLNGLTGKPKNISFTGIEVPSTAGIYKAVLYAKDINWKSTSPVNNESSFGEAGEDYEAAAPKIFWFAVDDAEPEFEEKTPNPTEVKYVKDKFTFGGTVKDDWKLADTPIIVSINGTEDSAESAKVILDNTKNPPEWSYEFAPSKDGNYKIILTAKDATGKSVSVNREVQIDGKAPVFGTTAHDENPAPAKVKPYVVPAAHNGFHNYTTLTISGGVSDSDKEGTAGSGIDKVTVKIDDGTPEDVVCSEDGTFNYVYRITDTNKTSASIKLTVYDKAGNTSEEPLALKLDFIKPEMTISTIDSETFTQGAKRRTNGENKIVIAGTSNDVLPSGETDTTKISGIDRVLINVNDTEFVDSSNKDKYTSKATVAADGSWSAEFTQTQISGFGDNNTVYARVYDKAQNYSDYTLFTLLKDATPPDVSIDDIVTAVTGSADVYVNGELTISGHASDNEALKLVNLYYYVDTAKTGFKDASKVLLTSIPGASNWSYVVDTTTGFGQITDETDVWLCAEAVDEGGNSKSVTKKIIVDQDSDRPIIKFNNLDLSGMSSTQEDNKTWLKNTKTLIGMVSDDDGAVKYLGYNKAEPASDTDYTEITTSGGTWELPLDDGQYSVWFKVKDAKDAEFYSCANINAAGAKKSPKLLSEKVVTDDSGNKTTQPTYFGTRKGTETDGKLSSILYYKVDVTPPDVTNYKYYSFDSTKGTSGEYETGDVASLKFGGVHQKLKMSLDASDINGIDSVYVYQDANKNGVYDNGELKADGTCEDANYADASFHTWTVTDVDISSFKPNSSGAVEFSVVITDKAGLSEEQTFQINIDNEPATLVIDSPSNMAQIRKEFIIKGQTKLADTSTEIRYIISDSNTAPSEASWKTAKKITGGVQSWYLYVDGDVASDDGYTHEQHHKDLFVSLYGTAAKSGTDYGIIRKQDASRLIVKKTSATDTIGGEERYETNQPFYFHFRVTDGCGNISDMTRVLVVDPQGDMPLVELSYPTVEKYGWYCKDAPEGQQWRQTNNPGTKIGDEEKVGTLTYKYCGGLSTLSGIIRAYGSAEGENGIYGVYAQIDPAYDPTKGFNETGWNGTGDVPSIYSSTAEKILKKYNEDPQNAGSQRTGEMKGIYIGNNPSWNFTMNTNGELNSTVQGKDNNYVAVRFYAVDNRGNISTKNPMRDIIIIVDSKSPKLGSSVPFVLYRYKKSDGSVSKDSSAGAVLETKEYQDDMWISGKWWLKGSVEDESGISELTIDDVSVINDTSIAEYHNDWGSNKGYLITKEVGDVTPDAYGKLEYTLYAKDLDEGEGKPVTKTFVINFDNKAPEPETKSGDNYDINEKIVNDNGVYKITSGVTEDGKESGFDKVVVYFKRGKAVDGGSNDVLFDNYIKRGATGNKVEINTNVKNEDGLYWKKNTVSNIDGKTITVSADANIHKGGLVKFGGTYFTITEKSAAGGNLEITLDETPSEELNGKEILFAIGNVIDHKGSEKSGKTLITTDEGYGYYSGSVDNTDDYMVEKVSTIGTKTVWSGSINSLNMTDGPIEVHYVVFDKAGNYFDNFATENSAYNVNAKVGNNAPRLASVRVESKYTGENKTKYYTEVIRRIPQAGGGSIEVARSKEVTSLLVASGPVKVDDEMKDGIGIPTTAGETCGTAFITAKSDVDIYPEIVGGNGDLYYSYMWGKKEAFINAYDSAKREFVYSKFTANGTTAQKAQKSAAADKLGTGHYDYIDNEVDTEGYYIEDVNKSGYIKGHTGSGATDDAEASSPYKISISRTDLAKFGTNSNADPTWFEFTIWDSTPGTTKFAENNTASLNAKIQLAMNVHVTDLSVPKVVVNPFFWKSTGAGNNSLYEGKLENGHIELEADWANALYEADGTTVKESHTRLPAGLKDNDPKVSGKITIRGTAYDDIELKELKVAFEGLIGTAVSAATYSRTAQADGSYKGTWTIANGAKDFTANHWSFSVTDSYFDGNGHKADWEFNIDTSYITNAADVNKKFTISAVDKANKNSSTANSTDTVKDADGNDVLDTSDEVYNKPGYQMDIVPYIRTVVTNLSSKLESNATVYSRSALGKYAVYDGENVTVKGFNFAAGSTDLTNQTISATGKWNIPAVNGLVALNNYNLNDAAGYTIDDDGNAVAAEPTQANFATYFYNRQPNGKNNNILTDDVEFDVWQFNSKAAIPTAGKVNNPVMKISPTSGMIGFAFSNGAERFSMGGTVGGTEYSYRKWNMSFDYMKHNEFAYDSEGHTYGTTVGGDISGSDSVADLFSFMSDRWGVVTKSNSEDDPYCNNQGNKHIKLDAIGQYTTSNKVLRDKNRFQSPSIATLRNGKTAENEKGTYVYLSYYDKILSKICFKAGNLLDTNTTGSNFDSFHDNGGGTTTKATSEAWSYLVPGNAGAYTAVGVTSDNVVVLIWYDGADLQCMYNKTPQTFTDNVIKRGWVGPTQLLTGAGEYCKLVVDSDNNVHIATYDSTKNDLKYVYIPYDATNKVPNVAGKKTATVDSLNDLGENITIDVAKSGDYQIPYIGYWGSYPALPRVASIADPASFYAAKGAEETTAEYEARTNGVIKDKYTGVWECSIVPTQSTAVQNTVNVGVWKTAGVLAASNGGTNKWADSTANGTSGQCYGNGTSNPVLGYLVSPSSSEQYIETAQKK